MNKILLLLIAILTFSTLTFAVPVNPEPVVYTQPDGSKITLRAVGDEYGSWLETADKTIVVLNNEGYIEYATIVDGEVVGSGIRFSPHSQTAVRRAPSRNGNSISYPAYDLPSRDSLLSQLTIQRENLMAALDSMNQADSEGSEVPTVIRRVAANGPAKAAKEVTPLSRMPKPKVLCILMNFPPDKNFTLKRSDFVYMWNSEAEHDIKNHKGSVRDFFREDSYGQMDVTANVVGPFTAKYKWSHYKKSTLLLQVSSAKALVKEAINAAISSGVKLSDYDSNGDGIVDAVHVIYAGYGNDDGLTNVGLFRSHKDEVVVKQGGYQTQAYMITPELDGASGSTICPFGTVCHEFGHVLGAPDFYDKTGGQYGGTGFYDLMGLGCRNDEGRCPAHSNPLVKMLFHWAPFPTTTTLALQQGNLPIPIILPNDIDRVCVLKPSYKYKDFYLLPTGEDDDYFILENKAASGYDTHIPYFRGGLLVYHAHKGLENAIKNNTVNNAHPQKFYIVDAYSHNKRPNALSSSYGSEPTSGALGNIWTFGFEGNHFFTPESTPSAVSWNGKSLGINLCFIKPVAEGMQFVVNPQTIDGPDVLNESDVYATYVINNIASHERIEWSLINASGINIEFIATDRAMLLKRTKTSNSRKKAAIDSHITPEIASELLKGKIVVLQAAISVPIYQNAEKRYYYYMFKDIALGTTAQNAPARAAISPMNENPEDIETQQMQEENVSYRLVYANPVINTADIRVEKFENGVYVPFEGEYTLSLWGDRAGMTHQRAKGQPNCTFDCENIPMGVYQLVLQINGKIAASSKMLKLM